MKMPKREREILAICPHCGKVFLLVPGGVCPDCAYPFVDVLERGSAAHRHGVTAVDGSVDITPPI